MRPIDPTDLIGKKFGRLTVVMCLDLPKKEHHYRCRCDCGKTNIVGRSALKKKRTISCGCWGAEKRLTASTQHGLSKTSEWRSWMGMKMRCTNPNFPAYRYYGARGIKVCDEWLNDFKAFFRDMGKKPTPKHSLGRINNDGNYEKSNCAWQTMTEQCQSRRSRLGQHHVLHPKTLIKYINRLSEKQRVEFDALLRGE